MRVGEEAAVEQRDQQDEAAAAQALDMRATISNHEVPIGDRRVVDAWLVQDVLEWDWETQRRAQAELALLDDGSSDPLMLGRAVDALARTALGEAETGLASELHLEAQADGVFASKHGALAARARTRPWDDWADHEQESLREFLEDVRVHGVAYDEHDFDAKRLAAFPQFESADHKSTADPEQIAKLLAAQGVFPDMDDAQAAAELLERGIKAENSGLTSDLVAALRDPLSREHRRAAAAKRARGERGLLDRLAVAEGGEEEPAPSKE